MVTKPGYEEVQSSAFSALVKDGTYSGSFDHPQPARLFFQSVMTGVLTELGRALASGLSVIDCGCGNGTWLDYLTGLEGAEHIRSLRGFDLTPEMTEVAAFRLEGKAQSTTIKSGNILDPASYGFPGSCDRYDLVFTYDVVQQLPVKLQFQACETIIEHLAPGGIAVIFDNDSRSNFGRRKKKKKFLTRYFGFKLVPEYYCNAHYPPLEKFGARLEQKYGIRSNIEISPNGVKRALVLRRAPT